MNSTIIELSVHTCNFVLKVLHREEPRARVWPKLMLKLQPKIAIFSKFHYIRLPSCITSIPMPLFTLVTQLSKSVEKNLASYGLLNLGTNTSCPSKAMPNGPRAKSCSFVVQKYTDSYLKIDLKRASDQRNKHIIQQNKGDFIL